jgi:hypothetical protein
LIVARIEIEVEFTNDGKMLCNTQVTDPLNEDELPALITVLGAVELSKDTIMHMYMDEDDG